MCEVQQPSSPCAGEQPRLTSLLLSSAVAQPSASSPQQLRGQVTRTGNSSLGLIEPAFHPGLLSLCSSVSTSNTLSEAQVAQVQTG